MGERDAFGREKGEDSLADMGWKTDGLPSSKPATRTTGESSVFNAGEAASPFARPKAPDASPSGGAAAASAGTEASRPSAASPLGGAAAASAGIQASPGAAAAASARPEAASPLAAGSGATPQASSPVFAAGEASAPFARQKPRPEARRGAPARVPPPARPRRRGPSLARLVVFLAVVGVIVAGTGSVVRMGSHAVDGLRDRIGAIASPEPVAPSPGPQASFLRAAGLRDAIAKLPAGKLVLVRIGAGSVDAQVISSGERHVIHMEPGATMADITAPVGVDQPGFKLAAAAPLRVIRTATRRAHRSVDDIDYLVGTEQGWVLFFKGGGPHYRATPSGRHVTKF